MTSTRRRRIASGRSNSRASKPTRPPRTVNGSGQQQRHRDLDDDQRDEEQGLVRKWSASRATFVWFRGPFRCPTFTFVQLNR
jgi:hypothetical protein